MVEYLLETTTYIIMQDVTITKHNLTLASNSALGIWIEEEKKKSKYLSKVGIRNTLHEGLHHSESIRIRHKLMHHGWSYPWHDGISQKLKRFH